MFTSKSPLSLIGLIFISLLINACRGPASTPTVTSYPTAPPAATSTTLPPTENSAKETWDYVAMGVFARSATSYIPSLYANYIEQDQGVEIILNEQARWEPEHIHENLRTNEVLRLAIREAEVITFDFAIDWLTQKPWGYFEAGLCKGVDNQVCLRTGIQKAKDDWTGIIDFIAELRDGSPVLLRVFLMGDWFFEWDLAKLTPEKKEVLMKYYHEFMSFLEEDAQRRGIPIIHVFPDPYFDEYPPREYLQSDGIHFSELGSMVIVEVLRASGYEFIVIR